MDASFHQTEMITLNSKGQGSRFPDPPPPRDHLVWSLVSFVYCNPCCCAFWALLYSIQARDRLHSGDVEGARSYGRKARRVNIIVTAVVTTLFVAYITYLIWVFVNLSRKHG